MKWSYQYQLRQEVLYHQQKEKFLRMKHLEDHLQGDQYLALQIQITVFGK